MAFYNRIGSMLNQSILQHSGSSMTNAIRCMSTKLFVGGLSFGTDDGSLRDAFASFGEVIDARVITDRETGRSRGFGFVNFADDEAATTAMSSMDGQDLNGRAIRVSVANDRPPAPRGGGYGGGGFSGGGGYNGSRSNDGY
ncbi:hypothetical protein SOVF_067940 [Spinacia oleracea]|uniref:Glycine-rich RNA-binding protein 2, mitochondrial n=1 Tax=Spinacia oleracea TaxID=3562 RepID=A0A9R0HV80_SPIOL|nr:glycine-rich RNA-binding protein 2, mitochondrial-like [Spinacia oleracea]KNA18740.1 hypothetical protein SOVF_067940 [Spinacia oleracea]